HIAEMTSELNQGYKAAKNMRDELRKKESRTYRKLIKRINDISYEPVPAKQKYDKSLTLIHETTLTEWEREDLLTQTKGIYEDILSASPYEQIFAMLIHFRNDNVTKIHKVNNSIKLIKSSNLTPVEKQQLLEQVNIEYSL
ncbi:MAG TPA: hypothetical protein VFW77_01960, partial [Candidatus Saccharimonadales bacterium]|nr:hypothetical protein [Candidatus Saccharimonadales bacterium]